MKTSLNSTILTATRLLAAAAALSLPAVGAFAQASAPMPASAAMPAAMASTSMANGQRMKVSSMIGSNVMGAADKKVGDIKDVIVDMTNGKVRYALLEFDPGFFKSEKLFAVPVSALGASADGKTLTYREVSREQLTHASVDKKDWERAVDNRLYVAGLDKNYGFKPPAGTEHSMRASKIIGRDVDSRTGKDIGKIKDLVVDMADAKIQYTVLAFDPSWFSSAKLFAFPLTAFKTRGDKDELVLDVDKSMLASMKNFDADKWGHLNDLNRDDAINTMPGAVAK